MTRHLLFAAAALLALAACKPAALPPPPPAPVQAVRTPSVYDAAAQAFADDIYRGYQNGVPPALVAVASPGLHQMLTGVDALALDPFCDCEVPGAVQYSAAVASADAHSAIVEVHVLSMARAGTVTLDLTMTPLGWRLDDLHGSNPKSLRAQLREGGAKAGPYRIWGPEEPAPGQGPGGGRNEGQAEGGSPSTGPGY